MKGREGGREACVFFAYVVSLGERTTGREATLEGRRREAETEEGVREGKRKGRGEKRCVFVSVLVGCVNMCVCVCSLRFVLAFCLARRGAHGCVCRPPNAMNK